MAGHDSSTPQSSTGRGGNDNGSGVHIIWGSVELSDTSSVTRNTSSSISGTSGNSGKKMDSTMSSAKEVRMAARRNQRARSKPRQKQVQQMVDAGQVVVRQISRSSSGCSAEAAQRRPGDRRERQPDQSQVEVSDGTGPPLAERKGKWSQGSEQHTKGQCRPCAWVWKPNGCVNGKKCTFCHTCEVGQLKMRKKEKIAKLKAEAAEAAEVEVSASGADFFDPSALRSSTVISL